MVSTKNGGKAPHLAIRKLKQEDRKFEANLGYNVRIIKTYRHTRNPAVPAHT